MVSDRVGCTCLNRHYQVVLVAASDPEGGLCICNGWTLRYGLCMQHNMLCSRHWHQECVSFATVSSADSGDQASHHCLL